MLRHYAGVVAEFMAGKYRDCHPLSVWYEKTPSAAPQTAGRVPYGLVPRTRRTILVTPLIKLGLEQQMTIGRSVRPERDRTAIAPVTSG